MNGKASSYQLGLILVTASAVVWSTAGLFTRIIVADTATVVFWRGIFSAIGIAAMAYCVYGRPAFQKLPFAAWVYAVLSGFGMITFVMAFRYTSVAHVAIIYAAVPFIAGAAAWLLIGERIGIRSIIASSAAFLGVIVMVGLGNDGKLFGDFLALLMTFALAGMMIVGRRHRDIPMLPAAALSALIGSLGVLPFAHVSNVTPHDWVWLAGFGLFNSAIGLGLFTLGSQRIPPAETGLIGALDVPLAPLWIWMVFGDIPALATFIGGGIVLVAVIFHLSGSLRNSSAL
ncbi:DMT family transporter [Aestuariivirga sp.]|uniref:DMT family transporter n=1 Tax=Aestuariivirga sp. TaxID=2650926 RepID=UPI0039E2F17A